MNLTEQNNKTLRRIHSQINNINKVNPTEAFDICLAHARILNTMIAQMSVNDADYIDGVNKLYEAMISEGLATRSAHAND